MNYSEEERKAIENLTEYAYAIYDFVLKAKDAITILNLIETQKAEIENKNKIISLMAENLTTPINGKEWVIEYYTKLAEEEK